jgi:hypothetical protein
VIIDETANNTPNDQGLHDASTKSFENVAGSSGTTQADVVDTQTVPVGADQNVKRPGNEEDDQNVKHPDDKGEPQKEHLDDDNNKDELPPLDGDPIVTVKVTTAPPPMNVRQVKGMLRILLKGNRDDFVEITINRKALRFKYKHSKKMPKTHHFIVQDRERLVLYWYEQYAAIMTPEHIYIEFCPMSNGDIVVGVWETRCNRPFHAVLIYHLETKECELYTVADFRHIYPDVFMDVKGEFDFDAAYS